MSFELIEQVEDLFKDRDQWTSFLELSNQRNAIRDSWFRDFMVTINKETKPTLPWAFTSRNLYDYRWYISEYGVESFCLALDGFGNKLTLSLWAPQNKYDIKKLSEYLNQEDYSEKIKHKFDHIDSIGNESAEMKYVEHLSFIYDKKYDAIDLDNLAWFAHYKTKETVTQVLNEVDKFINDKEITGIIMNLNKVTLL
jgi:hypothetical protein